MTAEQIELERLDSELPELARAADEAAVALQRAQVHADDQDEGLWYGRRTGQLRAALEELENAQHEHERAQQALARNHQRRRQLEALRFGKGGR